VDGCNCSFCWCSIRSHLSWAKLESKVRYAAPFSTFPSALACRYEIQVVHSFILLKVLPVSRHIQFSAIFRLLDSATIVDDLAMLESMLKAGSISLPAIVGIRSAHATTTKPVVSRIGKKRGVMVYTTAYNEAVGRPNMAPVRRYSDNSSLLFITWCHVVHQAHQGSVNRPPAISTKAHCSYTMLHVLS
jgi:hypothetical protein